MTYLAQVDSFNRMILDPTTFSALLAIDTDPDYPTKACCPCPTDPPVGNRDPCQCYEFDARDLVRGNKYIVGSGAPSTIVGYEPGEPIHETIKCSFPLGPLTEDGTCVTPRDPLNAPSTWPAIMMPARLVSRLSARVRSCRIYSNTFSFGDAPLFWEWAGAAEVTNSLLTVGADRFYEPPPAPFKRYLVAHLRRVGQREVGAALVADESTDDVTTDQCYCGHPAYPLEESDSGGTYHNPFFLLKILLANTAGDPLAGWTVETIGGTGRTVYGPGYTAPDAEGWIEYYRDDIAFCAPADATPPRLDPFTLRSGIIREYVSDCGSVTASWRQYRYVDLLGL